MPKSFDVISEGNAFYLHPGERLTILFKFISFRNARAGGSSDYENAGSRMLNTLITKQSNGKLVGGFTLKVEPHEQVVDQSHVFFENGSEPVEIVLPVLYHSPAVNRLKPTLISTYENSTVDWLNEYEISLKFESPEIMTRLSFNILLYEDQYLTQLKENWKIEVNSYEAVSVVCKPGASVRFRLAVPQVDGARRVELHASDPTVIEFHPDYQEGFSLSEGSITVVNCMIKGNSTDKAVIVHCVSTETG